MARDDIREGDQPEKPRNDPKPDPKPPKGPNEAGYSPIKYGEKGLKTGVAKAGQMRNQPGFVPRGQRDGVPNDSGGMGEGNEGAVPAASYLSPEQQAKVDKWLGDSYDASKPLNIQLFEARWDAASPEQRRAMAARIQDQYLEGGPKGQTMAQFHSSYIDTLNYENTLNTSQLSQAMDEWRQNNGGWAQSQGEFDANSAFWENFATTPEGVAHIEGTGMSAEAWLETTRNSMQEGLDNYQNQSASWAKIQARAQRLGLEVPGFKPPGWDSTLAAIQEGTAPLPSAAMMENYPGIVADVAGIAPISTTQLLQNRRLAGYGPPNRDGGDTGAGASSTPTEGVSTMVYQPLFSSAEIEADYI